MDYLFLKTSYNKFIKPSISKKLWMLLMIMSGSNSFAQCTLFNEDCGIATVNTITSYTGWTNTSGATMTGTGSVSKTGLRTALTTNLSGNTNGNTTGASGSSLDSNLVTLTAPSLQTWVISNVNTTNYTLSQLMFNVRKSSGTSFAYSDLKVELQVGSAGWVAYTTSSSPALVPAHAECNNCWDYWTLNIPATINGSSSKNSNFQIRFTNTKTSGSRYFEIDDVILTGTFTGTLTAGTIGSNQTICYNTTPATLTNVTSPSGGSNYTYQWQSSANNSTWSSISGATSSTYSPGALTSNTYYRRAETSCGSTVYTSSVLITVTALPVISQLPASLQSRYKLDANALDAQGVNNGTLQNAPTATTDRFGNSNSAYSFNGSSQYISTAVSYSNPNQFSLSIWFQTTTSVGGRLIGFGDASTGGSGNRDRMAWMDNTGNIVFAVNPGTGYEIVSPKSYNDGSWHQLVVTCSSTAGHGTNMYMDGILVATNTSALGGQNYTGYWRINYDNVGWGDSPSSNYFKGSMDDVCIFNAELSSAQVTTIYNSPDGAGSNSPICLGGSLNLTATTLASATYGWTGPNSFSSSSQNPTVSNMGAANEGTYILTVTKSGCSSTAYTLAKIDYTLGTSITQIPSSGNITNYKFNGNANDATSINQGTLQNAPILTSDRFGVSNAAYTFDGSTQYVSTSKSYTTPNDITLSIWFKTTTTSGGKLIGFGNSQTGGSTTFDRHLYMDNTGLIYFGVNPASGRVTINSSLTYNDGNWHLAIATLSSTTGIVLYIDGTSVASNTTPLGGEVNTGFYKIGYDAIGSTWPSNPTSNYFSGSLDDILIYNRALSSTEVATLYSGPDGAGQNGPVCVGNTLTFSAPTISGASYSWSGPNSFSSTAQNPTLTYTLANAGTYTLNVSSGGCISRAYTIVTSNTTAAGQWTGNTSNSWQTASNWCGGVVPTSITDVTIPAVTTLPMISATANVRNLTINSSATLTNASTGILNVYGNFTNNGTFTDNSVYNSTGVVNFIGSSAQSITGTTAFKNLTLNNSAGLTLNSATTVNGILTLTAGTFATGGNLTQNLYTGAIAGTGSGATTGNINFTKTIWGDHYHYLSSPITGRTAADWNDDVTIKLGPTAYNLYAYNEALLDTNQKVGWTAITSLSTSLDDVKGYALYFPRWIYNTTLDVSGPYTHSASFTSATLTNTPSTTPIAKPSSDGWNLVGNPYPSTLDWTIASGWTKPASLNNAIYMWDGRQNRYTSYVSGVGINGGTQYIGSMQGFFVKMAAGGSGTLTVNNNARITSTLIDTWRTEASSTDIVRIKASVDTVSDETVIRFIDTATETFDDQFDAYKLYNSGNTPSLSSSAENENYSINSLPSTLIQKIIPLQLDAAVDGVYTLSNTGSGFTNGESIFLEDRVMTTMQDLSTDPTYSISLLKGSYRNRFFIHYFKNIAVTGTTPTSYMESDIQISALQQNVFILFHGQNSDKAEISISDALGKKIYSAENITIDSGRIDIPLNVNPGIYIVKVNTAKTSAAQQILIQK